MYSIISEDKRQVWSCAIAETLTMVPYMRDIIANIRPLYTDEEDFVAGIDKHWRCALGEDFFKLPKTEQCGVIVHEALHCVNNHFARAIILHGCMTDRDNVAADLEINTVLQNHLFIKLPKDGVFPKDFKLPEHQSYEYYYSHLPVSRVISISGGGGSDKDSDPDPDSNGDGANGDNKTGMNGSDLLGEDATNEITNLGMPEMSNAEKVTAKNNTFQRSVEHQKGIGNVAGLQDELLQLVIRNLSPAKVNWRDKLSFCLSTLRYDITNHKRDYSYRKINRRVGNKDIAPGMLSYKPKVMLGIDVSGSVSTDEHAKMMSEVEDILRQQSNQVEVFAMDTEIGEIQTVSAVSDIKLFNGGGTNLECGFKYVKELPKAKKPDIFIVMTDGENLWNDCREYLVRGMSYIILSTHDSSYLKDVDFAEVIIID